MPKRIQEEVASFLVDAMLETGLEKTQGKHHDFSVKMFVHVFAQAWQYGWTTADHEEEVADKFDSEPKAKQEWTLSKIVSSGG